MIYIPWLEKISIMKALIVASLASYSTTAVPLTDVTIREAIQAWFADSVNATTMYGPISTWDTSLVTNMDSLFDSDLLDTRSFNEDLSSWNTSLVTSMAWMFYGSSSFNCKNLSTWDTQTVENMSGMLASASSFQGDVALWDTSRVTSMYAMFYNASSFNGNLSHWDTSSVTDISFMFASASDFNGNVSTWDTSKVVDMDAMFHRASSFNHDISYWKTSKVVKMNFAFSSALSFNQTLCWDTSLAVTDRFDGGVPFASRSEWAPCTTSSQCANGCCSSVWSGDVLKCTPVEGFYSDFCVGHGDWTPCSTSSQCANGCCSSLYSEGVLKCTPMGGFNSSMCIVDIPPPLKLPDWMPCDKSYACSSGCCSGLYSGGVPKCTPVIGGFNPDICLGGSPTTKYGDWAQCSSSSQCYNDCCSGLYSEGELKCTPLLEGFNPINNGCVGATTKHADWILCSSSSECENGCCSGAWSGGELKCTPVGGFDSSICIVGSNPFSGSHGSFSTTPYPSCRSVQSAVPPHTFSPSLLPTKKSTPKPTNARVVSPSSPTSLKSPVPSLVSSDLYKCKSSSSGNYGIVTKNRAFISYNYQMQVLSNKNQSELVLQMEEAISDVIWSSINDCEVSFKRRLHTNVLSNVKGISFLPQDQFSECVYGYTSKGSHCLRVKGYLTIFQSEDVSLLKTRFLSKNESLEISWTELSAAINQIIEHAINDGQLLTVDSDIQVISYIGVVSSEESRKREFPAYASALITLSIVGVTGLLFWIFRHKLFKKIIHSTAHGSATSSDDTSYQLKNDDVKLLNLEVSVGYNNHDEEKAVVSVNEFDYIGQLQHGEPDKQESIDTSSIINKADTVSPLLSQAYSVGDGNLRSSDPITESIVDNGQSNDFQLSASGSTAGITDQTFNLNTTDENYHLIQELSCFTSTDQSKL